MPTDRDGGAHLLPIGRFSVSAAPAHVAVLSDVFDPGGAFRSDVLPASYPVVWLGREDIRAAIRETLLTLPGAQDRVPVHLSQTIGYDRALVPETDYLLALGVAGPDERYVLRLEGEVSDDAGTRHAFIAVRLALVPLVETGT